MVICYPKEDFTVVSYSNPNINDERFATLRCSMEPINDDFIYFSIAPSIIDPLMKNKLMIIKNELELHREPSLELYYHRKFVVSDNAGSRTIVYEPGPNADHARESYDTFDPVESEWEFFVLERLEDSDLNQYKHIPAHLHRINFDSPYYIPQSHNHVEKLSFLQAFKSDTDIWKYETNISIYMNKVISANFLRAVPVAIVYEDTKFKTEKIVLPIDSWLLFKNISNDYIKGFMEPFEHDFIIVQSLHNQAYFVMPVKALTFEIIKEWAKKDL